MPIDDSAQIVEQGARRSGKEGEKRGAIPPSLKDPAEKRPLAWAMEALKIDLDEYARKRRGAFVRRISLCIGLPTLLATVYALAYATPRYVSEFQITYQSFDQTPQAGQASLLSSVLGIGSSTTVDMSRVIASYLTSVDVLREVDKKVDLRRHYSNPRIDWLDRLPSGASQEQFLAYFQKRITVDALMGGYLIIDIEAFDRQTAARAAEAMAAAADQMVQAISDRALLDAVRFAEVELARTEGQLLTATLKVTNFRNEHHNFDPQAAATQLGTVVGGLESQLSSYRAALSSARNFVSEQSPAIKALHAQIEATEQQIALEQVRLASSQKGSEGSKGPHTEPYSQTVADYVYLTGEQQFAMDAYTSAKHALDLERANAASKRAYVNAFVKPNTPEKSTSPDSIRVIFGTMIVALLVYMIASLVIGAFRDQAGT